MDTERFEALARDPRRTTAELTNMRANAQAKGREDLVRIVDGLIRERRPVTAKKSGGKTPTTATFRQREQHFESGKEAYLWLAEQIYRFHAHVFEEYAKLHTRAGAISRGRRFARNPKDLFPADSSRQSNPSFYSSVGAGWYADVNLSHDEKFATLVQLSHLAGLKYEIDWDFKVLGATQELIKHQRSVARSDNL